MVALIVVSLTVSCYLNFISTDPNVDTLQSAEAILRTGNWTLDGGQLPFLLVGNIFEQKFSLCVGWFLATVMLSYGVMTWCEGKIMRALRDARGSMLRATRNMHNDVQKVLIVQVSRTSEFGSFLHVDFGIPPAHKR